MAGPPEQRVSKTGAVFTRDVSIPALGEAYRDPFGLIWGEVGSTFRRDQHSAESDCISKHLRLPTQQEYSRLSDYLGYGSRSGYSPYLADGKTDFLPGLSTLSFWTSTDNPRFPLNYYIYYGKRGTSGLDQWGSGRNGFRCVSGPEQSVHVSSNVSTIDTAEFHGQKFDCGSFQIFYATRSPGGNGSGIVSGTALSKGIFTSVSSYPIYQTYLALLVTGSSKGVYFIKKTDINGAQAGTAYEILKFRGALVDVDDPHQTYRCNYAGEN